MAKCFLSPRRLTAVDLEQLRHRISLLYVSRGYVNSGALIPEQDVGQGELRVRIVEGRLNEVKVTDITPESEPDWLQAIEEFITPKSYSARLEQRKADYVRDRLKGDPEQPLNTENLQEDYLKLLNDRMIKRLNGSLLPGMHPGEAVLDLKVTRARPYGGYVGVDNFSPPQIGGVTGRVGFWVDNLASLGERIDFNMSPTGGAFSYNTGIDIPLTASGTRFAFRYNDSSTVLIEPPLDTLNIVNQIVSYDGQLSHPLLWDFKEDFQQKLTLGANFAVRQNQETISGQPTIQGPTQVTVVRAWQDYLFQNKVIDAAFRSTFSMGVDVLGATAFTINADGRQDNGQFFAWLGQTSGRYHFREGWPKWLDNSYISLNGAVQLTNDRVLALEKIAIGGFRTVRGYRQNYLVRDQGFYLSLDAGYPLYGGEPGAKYGVYLVPFTDYGGAANQGERRNYIQSVGVGLEGYMNVAQSTLSAAFYWAGRVNLIHDYRGVPGSFPQGAEYDMQDNGINFRVNWTSN